MSERKIYPVSVRPKKDGEYLAYFFISSGEFSSARFYGFNDGCWYNAADTNYNEFRGDPDFWEELPKFDERFVVRADDADWSKLAATAGMDGKPEAVLCSLSARTLAYMEKCKRELDAPQKVLGNFAKSKGDENE